MPGRGRCVKIPDGTRPTTKERRARTVEAHRYPRVPTQRGRRMTRGDADFDERIRRQATLVRPTKPVSGSLRLRQGALPDRVMKSRNGRSCSDREKRSRRLDMPPRLTLDPPASLERFAT